MPCVLCFPYGAEKRRESGKWEDEDRTPRAHLQGKGRTGLEEGKRRGRLNLGRDRGEMSVGTYKPRPTSKEFGNLTQATCDSSSVGPIILFS